MVIVENHRHAVVGEHQKRQCPTLDFLFRHQMAHQRLEECLIRNPCGPEKAHHIGALFGEIQNPFHRAAAQTPPLAADHDLKIFGHFAGQAQTLLELEHPVEQFLLRAFVKDVAIDQAFFFPAGLDPVGFEVIVALDVIDFSLVQKFVRVFRRLDRHAVAGQHIKMRRARKCVYRGLDRVQSRLNKAPFPPSAADAFFRECDIWVIFQRTTDFIVGCLRRAGIKVDRHVIAHSCKAERLSDDGVRVFVT